MHIEATGAVALLVAAYAVAVRRFRAERWRIARFAVAAVLLLATAVTPIDSLSYHLLIVHLLQNVILAEWAPLLLVLSVPPLSPRASDGCGRSASSCGRPSPS